jgi:hypothetical protein
VDSDGSRLIEELQALDQKGVFCEMAFAVIEKGISYAENPALVIMR